MIPLVAAFGNPDLLEQRRRRRRSSQSLGAERQYKNDEQIDNSLRSVLFQVPKPGIPDPSACGAPVISRGCFPASPTSAPIDIERGRDHGMPYYNQLRQAYGLAPEHSFTEITGESTERFPRDPLIRGGGPIDDPDILDFVQLRDDDGNPLPLGSEEAGEDAVAGVRRDRARGAAEGDLRVRGQRSTRSPAWSPSRTSPGTRVRGAAARDLEAAVPGPARRRPVLLRQRSGAPPIEQRYGISYRHSLAEIIRATTGVAVQDDVFKVTGPSSRDRRFAAVHGRPASWLICQAENAERRPLPMLSRERASASRPVARAPQANARIASAAVQRAQ